MAKVFACIIVLAIASQLSTFPVNGLPAWSSYLKMLRGENLPRLGNIDEEGDNFEGDIIQSTQVKSGVNGNQFRWPNAIVPFTIAPTFSASDTKVIRDALKGIENATCLKFIPRTTESDYIQVNTGNGCSSYVGRQGGNQRITLGPGCVYYGIVQHEFVHASGFYHEHSRSDRDNFVDIIWLNILLPFWPQFFTQDNDNNFGVPYDYGSVMHYSEYAFATIPFIPTILANKKTDAKIGQRDGLSKLDILKLNRMYNCTMA